MQRGGVAPGRDAKLGHDPTRAERHIKIRVKPINLQPVTSLPVLLRS